ncbi:hypothetical protein [Nitrobacter sp.]|uniref:hypothetical protein n=1 Tax=Nitrobacter sp. TaxID=29420 RepID=UPI003F653FC0
MRTWKLVDLLWLKQALRHPMRSHDAIREELREQKPGAAPSKDYRERMHVEAGGNWDK